MLADLAVSPEVSQIKRMIRQIKFPRKNIFVTRKIETCQEKKAFVNRKIIVCSKIPFSKNLHHIETSQLICSSNQLTGFYMIRVFTERCFTADYKLPRFFSCMFFHAIWPTSLYTKVLVL